MKTGDSVSFLMRYQAALGLDRLDYATDDFALDAGASDELKFTRGKAAFKLKIAPTANTPQGGILTIGLKNGDKTHTVGTLSLGKLIFGQLNEIDAPLALSDIPSGRYGIALSWARAGHEPENFELLGKTAIIE